MDRKNQKLGKGVKEKNQLSHFRLVLVLIKVISGKLMAMAYHFEPGIFFQGLPPTQRGFIFLKILFPVK
jgi:hypothetical protein